MGCESIDKETERVARVSEREIKDYEREARMNNMPPKVKPAL
jgi:hypothetical protein